MITLKSKNITLRPIKLADAEFIFWCEQDKQARKNFMHTPKKVSEVRKDIIKQIKEMKKKNPKEYNFAIEWNKNLVGRIWTDLLEDKHIKNNNQASLGYMIHSNFRGKGIRTTAIKLITTFAFKKFKVKRIRTHTRTFNIGSRKALEKAGYKLEGILRKNKWKNGKYLDDCLYAKVR